MLHCSACRLAARCCCKHLEAHVCSPRACWPPAHMRTVFCVIMLSAYTANLAATLMVTQMAVPVRNLADLAASPSYFGVPAQSSVATYFSNSSDSAARNLRPKMVEYNSTADGVAAVRAGRISAFIGGDATINDCMHILPAVCAGCSLASCASRMGAARPH